MKKFALTSILTLVLNYLYHFGYSQRHQTLCADWQVVGQNDLCLETVFDTLNTLVLIPIKSNVLANPYSIAEVTIEKEGFTLFCADGAGDDNKFISGSTAVVIRSKLVQFSRRLAVLEMANTCGTFAIEWRGDSLFLRRMNVERFELRYFGGKRHLNGISNSKMVFDQISYLTKCMKVQKVNILCYPSLIEMEDNKPSGLQSKLHDVCRERCLALE